MTTKFKAGSLYWHDAFNGWYLYGKDPETGSDVFCNAITTDDEMIAYDPNDDWDLLEAYDLEAVE